MEIEELRAQNALLREQNGLFRRESEERQRKLERVEEKLLQLIEIVIVQGQEIEALKRALEVEGEDQEPND